MRTGGGIVSFSFDDVPASACRTGLEILERHGTHGTFYVSGALTDTVTPVGEMHTHADLLRLKNNGHEIGSHGFAHLNYQTLSTERAHQDIDANRRFFADTGLSDAGDTFAYPFGCANPRAKALVVHEFSCARTTSGGINIKTLDVGLLKAVALYDERTSEQDIAGCLEKTAAESGWAIFYTHEVCENHGAHGCSPQLLEFAVSQSRQLGLTVLPVKDAFGRASS